MILLPIKLPVGFTPIVGAGDKVKKDQVIADSQADKVKIDISKNLGVTPAKISKYILKKEGDRVEKGDLLAKKKQKLGFSSKKILSDSSGNLIKIDEKSGEIILDTGVEKKEIFSPVDGTVDFCNNEQIVVKTDAKVMSTSDGLGKEATGELSFISNLESEDILKQVSGKIVLVKNINKISLFKAIGLDALGIITCKLEDIDFVDLGKKLLETPVLMVTEDDLEALKKSAEKKVYINGENKIIVFL